LSQGQRGRDDQRSGVEPGVEAQLADDRDGPWGGRGAGAGHRLRQLHRAGDQVAQVREHGGDVGRVVGEQLAPPVGESAERVAEQVRGGGIVERRHARGGGEAEQRLELGAGAAQGIEQRPEQVRGQVAGGRDDGVRAGQVDDLVDHALEGDGPQFQ